jgi:uncharacterized membrane protein
MGSGLGAVISGSLGFLFSNAGALRLAVGMGHSFSNGEAPVAVAGERHSWLDAIRGLAVLGMIVTHTINTLLASEWKTGEMFGRSVYVSGLVAPTFLWIAGYAHGLGSIRRESRGDRGWPARTLRRLLLVLGLGYLIHLPLPGTGTTWRLFFGVDVLQCLAVTLLAVIALEKWLPRRSGIALALLAAVMVGWGALPAERAGLGTGFWPLEAWFDQSGLSLFPLVPWAGFVVAGVLMARWRVPLWGWPVLGLLLLALPSPPFISKSHPTFFLERLGWLLLAASVCRCAAQSVPVPRWLLWTGRESLVLYVVHLSLLYFVPTARWIGPVLDPWLTGLAALVLTVCSMGLAWVWRRAWNRRRDAAAPPAGEGGTRGVGAG